MRPERPCCNRPVLPAALLFWVTTFCAVHWVQAAPPPPGASLAPMLEQVLPAVVNISTRTRVQLQRYITLWW